MRILALVAFTFTLAACQSCRSAKVPAPPVPEPTGDSGTPADADVPETSVLADSGLPEASASDAGTPLDACLSTTVGNAHAFCEGPTAPIASSILPPSPGARGKLASVHSPSTDRSRLVVRHANGAKAKMKIVVVLTNDGPGPASFALLKKGVAGPTTNFAEGEALAMGRWASSGPKPAVSVPAGKSVRFDASVEVGLQQKFATMGYYEYSADQPHTINVCFLGEREDWSVCSGL